MPKLTNENLTTLLRLGKSEISKLTTTLNDEVSKVQLHSTQNELAEIFKKCEGILLQLQSKYDQFKKLPVVTS